MTQKSSSLRGLVQTVRGPVSPDALGVVLPHEHLLVDFVGDRPSPGKTASDRAKWLAAPTMANTYDRRRNISFYRDNSQLLSIEDAVEEAITFRASGGGCIVDVTSGGIGRDPVGLFQIANRSDVHIVMGAGYYVREFHPDEVAALSEDRIAEIISEQINVGIDGTTIRAGIIGEIGLTWPVYDDELKVLRASTRAHIETGAALSIHPGRHVDAPMEAVKVVASTGGAMDRTIMGHVDRTLFSLDAMLRLAETGCYLEFDLFGWENSFYPLGNIDFPSDATRVEFILGLVEAGFAKRVLISHDICLKGRCAKYGGEGRSHILDRVVPLMQRKGLDQEVIDLILVDNPARLLTLA